MFFFESNSNISSIRNRFFVNKPDSEPPTLMYPTYIKPGLIFPIVGSATTQPVMMMIIMGVSPLCKRDREKLPRNREGDGMYV